MKILVFSFTFLSIVLNANFAAAQANCQATIDLPNFSCVNDRIFRGAQPTSAGIKELAKRGVKLIIYLRGADEKARDEELLAQQAGIKFINIPLGNWSAPKDEKINQILNLIISPVNQPVFIHCKRGADRTGTVVGS